MTAARAPIGWPVPASSSATTGRGAVGRWRCGEEDGGVGRQGATIGRLVRDTIDAVRLGGTSVQQKKR
jgi:hypothetical protein